VIGLIPVGRLADTSLATNENPLKRRLDGKKGTEERRWGVSEREQGGLCVRTWSTRFCNEAGKAASALTAMI